MMSWQGLGGLSGQQRLPKTVVFSPPFTPPPPPTAEELLLASRSRSEQKDFLCSGVGIEHHPQLLSKTTLSEDTFEATCA